MRTQNANSTASDTRPSPSSSLRPAMPALSPYSCLEEDRRGPITCRSWHTGVPAAPHGPAWHAMPQRWPCGRSVACWRWWSRSRRRKLLLPPGEQLVYRNQDFLQPLDINRPTCGLGLGQPDNYYYKNLLILYWILTCIRFVFFVICSRGVH